MMNLREFSLEINRWLAVRWKTSDYFRHLPTMERTLEYAKKVFDGKMQDIFRSTLVDDEALNGMAPEPWAVHMMDLVLHKDLCCMDIVSYTMRDMPETYLVRLKLNCELMEMDEDKCFAVRSVSVEDPEQELQELGLLAVTAAGQFDAGKLFERWVSAPLPYREAHLLCPRCGAEVESLCYDDEYHPDYRVSCSHCCWTGPSYTSKYESVDEFVRKDFEQALKKLQKEKVFLSHLDASTGSAVDALDVIISMASRKHYASFGLLFDDRLNAIERKLEEARKVVGRLKGKG